MRERIQILQDGAHKEEGVPHWKGETEAPSQREAAESPEEAWPVVQRINDGGYEGCEGGENGSKSCWNFLFLELH